ncbi:MAG TPA: hypothetical protein GX708_06925, partial [Gallicola sp.]|nr:hypothetical protein [Gallicola sp.]
KKAIVESLANGDIEMRFSLEKETINDYTIMRTIALSLAKTITIDSTSAIKKSFEDFLNPEIIERIKENFSKEKIVTDISISWDQTENLKTAIFSGLEYPVLTENYQQNRAEIKAFLKKISEIFKWDVYEKKYLGTLDDTETYWFAVILEKWMTGQPLKEIIRIALAFAAKYPFDGVKIGNNKIANTFNPDNYTHVNSIIVDALQRLENTVRFSIANYFRAFSSAYREIHPDEEFNADWYEYVEYGSMDPTVKMLQQLGFSRSSSLYIVKHQDEYLDFDYIEPKIKVALMYCPEEIIRNEARVLSYNIAEYIVE